MAQRTDLRGLLLRSGKPGQFIAGADLNDLAALAYITPEQAAGALGAGHQIFSGLSRLPFPTVALIDGNCLGGGTELVLSMDDRLASAAAHTQIGLPEVKIGLIPGWGGTQRLPRLIGLNPGDRDDHFGRAGLGRRRPSRWAWPSTPSRPIAWSRKARGGSSTSSRAASGRRVASSSVSRWGSIRMR